MPCSMCEEGVEHVHAEPVPVSELLSLDADPPGVDIITFTYIPARPDVWYGPTPADLEDYRRQMYEHRRLVEQDDEQLRRYSGPRLNRVREDEEFAEREIEVERRVYEGVWSEEVFEDEDEFEEVVGESPMMAVHLDQCVMDVWVPVPGFINRDRQYGRYLQCSNEPVEGSGFCKEHLAELRNIEEEE